MAMLRYNLLMLAVGGLTMVAITPRDQADAQSGQALAFAEHACLEYGVTPGTQTFERCVVRPPKRSTAASPTSPTPRRVSRGPPEKRAVIGQNAKRD